MLNSGDVEKARGTPNPKERKLTAVAMTTRPVM